MDPVSQAALGAALAQSTAQKPQQQKAAMIIGALSGMAPDLDVLIRSSTDPLLFLEFHRQFTHSLLFIPFGALLCALVFFAVLRRFWPGSGLGFKIVYGYALAGFATHGLLDACTSYGTQLYWPFSNTRVAWNTVAIVDPLFTLVLLIFIVLAAYRRRALFARLGFAFAVLYLAAGLIPKQQAMAALQELAASRGHVAEHIRVKPAFGNRHVWKLLYEYDGRYYVDAVNLLASKVYEGTSIEKLDVARDLPWLPADSQQARDIERFRWFSDGYLALSSKHEDLITDVRYSFVPNRINPMWGLALDRVAIEAGDMEVHADFLMLRNSDATTRRRYMDMLLDRDENFVGSVLNSVTVN